MTNDPVPVNALKNADAALRAANLSPQSPLFQIVAEGDIPKIEQAFSYSMSVFILSFYLDLFDWLFG